MSLAEAWDEEWLLQKGNRFSLQRDFIESLVAQDSDAILDVGGKDFYDHFSAKGIRYDMIDVERRLGKGFGGHNPHPKGATYDGRTLPYGRNSYDIVIIGFVLHHAAQNTVGLLEQVREISRKHVVILEDLASPEYPTEWLDRNHRHQPGGVFRDDREWRRLFELTGFRVQRTIRLKRADDPDERTYRALYHLTTASD